MAVYLPAAHTPHAVLPPATWNFPLGQSKQEVWPVHSLYCPGAQATHCPWATSWNWPALHVTDACVGTRVGTFVGSDVGLPVGTRVGTFVGVGVGSAVGA